MSKDRLEAFSDGVIAILITIMVLELKVPHGAELAALRPLLARVSDLCPELRLPGHLLEQSPPHAARDRTGDRRRPVGQPAPAVLAVAGPVRHRMDGQNHFASAPTALYGVVLLLAAIAYTILQRTILLRRGRGRSSPRPSGPTSRASCQLVLYAVGPIPPPSATSGSSTPFSACWSRSCGSSRTSA